MYQMYMSIAQELYDKINQKRKNEGFEVLPGITEQDEYERYMYEAFSRFTTDRTIGFEGESNIGFALIECLKSINLTLAEKLEAKLNKEYSKCKFTCKTEDVCQRYFHFGKRHIENIIELIDKYHSSLSSIEESKLDKEIIELLPTIKDLLNSDKHNPNQLQEYITKFENANINLTTFCDNIEYRMQKSFVKSLNIETQKTVSNIEEQKSKLKVMDRQDFDLLITSSTDPEDFLKNEHHHNMLSTSLIDDKNIRCYQSGNVKFAFYQPINQDELISAFSGDASTTFTDDGILSSFSVPDYIPTKNFKGKTRDGSGLNGYSEIMIKGNVKANAIVCFDYVTEQELNLAEKYDLDLILIKTECYKDMLMDEKRDEKYVKKANLSTFETKQTL